MKKTLIYVMDMRLPNEYIHSFQVMKMSETFAKQGYRVELVLPKRWQTPELRKRNVWHYYDIPQNAFSIVRLPCLDIFFLFFSRNIWWLRLRALLATLSFYVSLLLYLSFKRFDIIFTREYEVVVLGRVLRGFKPIRVLLESHGFPEIGYQRWLARFGVAKADAVFFTTKLLMNRFQESGWKPKKLVWLPNGIEESFRKQQLSQREARKQLHITQSSKVIVYSGQLFRWKGVETLILSKHYLPQSWQVIIVGGLEADLQRLKNLTKLKAVSNVSFVGKVSQKKSQRYLKAADILVLPNSGRFRISREETSPIKLFEYMAARRPIVASRLPAIQEVLRDGETAILFEPDKPRSLAKAIKKIMKNKALGRAIARKAWHEVRNFTWQARVGKVAATARD